MTPGTNQGPGKYRIENALLSSETRKRITNPNCFSEGIVRIRRGHCELREARQRKQKRWRCIRNQLYIGGQQFREHLYLRCEIIVPGYQDAFPTRGGNDRGVG